MKRQAILKILEHYKKLLEEKGYKVIYIGLYGSQNYNLADEFSDIDAKAIVLPTLSQIIRREPISAILETKTGNIDYKDIITFNNVIRKGNFSYIEAIQSCYRIGDIPTIERLFGDIQVNLKSLLGAMMEKRKALTHEYPSKAKEFELYGCDPKQYHHILRLFRILSYNIANNANRSYLIYDNDEREEMITLKRRLISPLEDLEKEADSLITLGKYLLNSITPDYKYLPIDNQKAIDDYLEEQIKKEIIDSL